MKVVSVIVGTVGKEEPRVATGAPEASNLTRGLDQATPQPDRYQTAMTTADTGHPSEPTIVMPSRFVTAASHHTPSTASRKRDRCESRGACVGEAYRSLM